MLGQNVDMNAARLFQRREDNQPPTTPNDSPFRRFAMSCLKCVSFKPQVMGEFDLETGELDMRTDFVPHPCGGRVRDVPVPDSERELKSLKISLKICPRLQ